MNDISDDLTAEVDIILLAREAAVLNAIMIFELKLSAIWNDLNKITNNVLISQKNDQNGDLQFKVRLKLNLFESTNQTSADPYFFLYEAVKPVLDLYSIFLVQQEGWQSYCTYTVQVQQIHYNSYSKQIMKQ